MAERAAVCDLAREFGLSSADIIAFAKSQGMALNRAAALLTVGQEKKLRDAYTDRRLTRRYSPLPQRHFYDEGPRELHTRCKCCTYPIAYLSDEYPPAHCRVCEDHYEVEGEESRRTIARLAEHSDRYYDTSRRVADQSAENRERMIAAFRSRDIWKRTLVEMALAHERRKDGPDCVCGGGKYPCVSRRVLEGSNRGIAKRVEELEGLSEKDLMEVLYGDMSRLGDWQPTDD